MFLAIHAFYKLSLRKLVSSNAHNVIVLQFSTNMLTQTDIFHTAQHTYS